MPSSTNLKKLYYAKSIEELNKRIESLPPVNDVTKCSKAAYKLFKVAASSEESGDEELAYIRYMKFVSFYSNIRRARDYEKNKKFCSDILGDTPLRAMKKAEELQRNLMRRYELQDDANKLTVDIINDAEQLDKEALVEKEKNKTTTSEKVSREIGVGKDKNKQSSKPDLITDGKKTGREESITSLELYEMIHNPDISLIILDARPAKDFEESHMKFDFCVNVAEEILVPGMTAVALEKKLPVGSLSCWKKRGVVDFVIILDWRSKSSDVIMKHPLHTLSEAIFKWDLTYCLKSSPLVLEGGYDNWMLHYPVLTTNANILRTSSHSDMPSLSDIKFDIDYPDLDKAFIETPESLPTTLNINDKTSPLLHLSGNKVPKFPSVNRDLKPPKDGLFVNGSATESTGVSLKQSNESSSDSELTAKPLIDRKLKPKSSLTTSTSMLKEYLDSGNKDSVSQSLEKEESILEENIKVGAERLQKEKEFEILRHKKLYETEEKMRLDIQKQEEELLAKVQALEQQAQMKELEYQKLKEENSEIKKELDRVKEKGEDADRLRKLQEKEAQKKQLMEEVERLREVRKMKEKKEVDNRRMLEKSDQPPAKSDRGIVNQPDVHVEDIEHFVPLKDQSTPGTPPSHGGLSRSHSSPNIAQLVEDEANQAFVPKFDRSLKPPKMPGSFSATVRNTKIEELNAARKRNLQPIYGNQGHAVTGLRNLGNTCFMNAVIQCLGLTIPLSMYFVRSHYHNDIVRESKQSSKGEVAEEFAAVIRALWTGVYKSITPRDFKNTVSKYLSVCVGYEQQDSHEFLIVLLEKLHADLNKARPVQQGQKQDLDNLPAEVAQEHFWTSYKKINKSVISDLFEGLLQSSLKCLHCNKTSDSFEVFSFLSLPITSSRKCSLTECLELFLEAETMTGDGAWHCPRCKQKQEARKKMMICRLPEILIIHLKRFSFEGMWRRKLETYVDFPLELQMRSYVSQLPVKNQSLSYKLYAVVNHHGTMEGGHYISYCKNSAYDKWYKYDDHEVFAMAEGEVKTSAAYILFYSCTDFRQYLQQ